MELDASESILPPLREPVGLLDEADQDKIALHPLNEDQKKFCRGVHQIVVSFS